MCCSKDNYSSAPSHKGINCVYLYLFKYSPYWKFKINVVCVTNDIYFVTCQFFCTISRSGENI